MVYEDEQSKPNISNQGHLGHLQNLAYQCNEKPPLSKLVRGSIKPNTRRLANNSVRAKRVGIPEEI
jgi:hypothetical protein